MHGKKILRHLVSGIKAFDNKEINVNPNGPGFTPLQMAVGKDLKITRLLLSHPNIDPNLSGENYGLTPLRAAARFNSLEAAYLLLKHPKTDVNAIDSPGNTNLDIAIINKHY